MCKSCSVSLAFLNLKLSHAVRSNWGRYDYDVSMLQRPFRFLLFYLCISETTIFRLLLFGFSVLLCDSFCIVLFVDDASANNSSVTRGRQSNQCYRCTLRARELKCVCRLLQRCHKQLPVPTGDCRSKTVKTFHSNEHVLATN